MDEMNVELKCPRGSIKEARVLYEEDEEPSFRAWIYLGKGKTTYAEMQTTQKGSRDIKSFFEFGDMQGDQDVGPKYQESGEITHRNEINSLDDWKAWLIEYAKGLDPIDAFRFYRESVGPF